MQGITFKAQTPTGNNGLGFFSSSYWHQLVLCWQKTWRRGFQQPNWYCHREKLAVQQANQKAPTERLAAGPAAAMDMITGPMGYHAMPMILMKDFQPGRTTTPAWALTRYHMELSCSQTRRQRNWTLLSVYSTRHARSSANQTGGGRSPHWGGKKKRKGECLWVCGVDCWGQRQGPSDPQGQRLRKEYNPVPSHHHQQDGGKEAWAWRKVCFGASFLDMLNGHFN